MMREAIFLPYMAMHRTHTSTSQDGAGFHYYKIPTICLSDAGELVEVHYNERTRGPMELPAAAVGRVYRALARFQAIALRPENCVEVKMKAGDCVAFNNRRILHGRKAFDPRTGWVRLSEFGRRPVIFSQDD